MLSTAGLPGFVLRRFTVEEIAEVFQIRHLLEPAAAVMALPFVNGAALKRLNGILAMSGYPALGLCRTRHFL